jgi:hypothetical protein
MKIVAFILLFCAVLIGNLLTKKNSEPIISTKEPTPVEVFDHFVEHNSSVENHCIIYGPIGNNNKDVIDKLLVQAKLDKSFDVIEQPVYEVYWNLGKDKITAINLFESQKNNGPFQDERYKLLFDNDGTWIVSVAKIISSEKDAVQMATQLALKSSKLKIGGKWQYRTLNNLYFYHTNNASLIPSDVDAVLLKTFNVDKSNCQ